MGEREANRRSLLSLIKECIAATNQAIAATDKIADLHNGLTGKMEEEFAARDVRLTAHAEWCEKNEVTADAALELAKALDDRVTVLSAHLLAFVTMGFWARLRYALTGHWPRPIPAPPRNPASYVLPLTGYIPGREVHR